MTKALAQPVASQPPREGDGSGSSRLARTTRHSMLALTDQMVVSGANLLTAMLIARFGSKEELGAYALGFTVVLLIIAVQEALITTPYTVFGCRLPPETRRKFSGSALLQTALLSLMCMIGLTLGAYLLSLSSLSSSVATVFLALAAVVPFLLLREFARRFTLADLDTGTTLLIDVTSVALQVVLLGLLAATSWLAASTAHLVVGLAGGCVGLAWLMIARNRFQFCASRWKEDVSRGWALGRWFLVGQTTTVVQAYSIPWLLAGTLGLKAAGVFAVCTQIISFSNPVILGIGNILNPKVAWAFAEGGVQRLKRLVFHTTIAQGVVLGLFALFMAVWGGKLAALMFGAEYAGYGMVIAVLGLGPLIHGVSMATGYGLTVVEKPHWHLITGVVGAVVTLGATLLLAPWGLLGAAWGSIAGIGAASALRSIAFWGLPTSFDVHPVAASSGIAVARHDELAPLASGE